MKAIFDRLTLMRHCHPDDDYKLTPLRVAAGAALFGALLFGPNLAGQFLG